MTNGAIGPGTTIVEISSGSTAISLGWFARRLGLPFVAVVPAATAPAKLAAIREMGGDILAASTGSDLEALAEATAKDLDRYHINQFARAATAGDWREDDNIGVELIAQLRALGLGAPKWIVTGAGTGGSPFRYPALPRPGQQKSRCSALAGGLPRL